MQQAIFGSVPNTSNAIADKTVLRRALRASRDALSPEDAQHRSRAATAALLADACWQKARQVALYMAMPRELSTVSLIKEAWVKGKGVWLPRCAPKVPGEPGVMSFVRCDHFDDLVPGVWGILEPRENCPVLDPERDGLPDLVIVPALGLDRQGTRLGYGGGYYDRLLREEHWAAVPRIGLVFACQIVNQPLPRDPWDMAVNALLCEEGLTWL